VQHLLLGINAQVNHDLAQAIVEVAHRYDGLEAMRDDFDLVNDVLARTYTGVIRDLDRVSRWASEAAMLGGGELFKLLPAGGSLAGLGVPPSASIHWMRRAGGSTCASSTGWSRSWPTWSRGPCSLWDRQCG
jgi:hypothetical protein